MEKYVSVLCKSRLFTGVSEKDLLIMLKCLEAQDYHYKKGEYVFCQGELLNHITVLVSGELHIQKDDYWGNRSILNRVGIGEMFGEAYLAQDEGVILNDVVAAQDSVVVFFDVKRIITTCSSACNFHTQVVQNLFFSISEKNRNLVQKLGHISKRTTREKLISYLSEEAKRQKNGNIVIPFNRQQLADFLSVDRSAMSNELCKMRDEGLLKFDKNKFVLLQN